MKKNMKLVPKCKGNLVVIFLCMADGRKIDIAKIIMPDDGLLCNNVDCVKDIVKALEKRINNSM